MSIIPDPAPIQRDELEVWQTQARRQLDCHTVVRYYAAGMPACCCEDASCVACEAAAAAERLASDRRRPPLAPWQHPWDDGDFVGGRES